MKTSFYKPEDSKMVAHNHAYSQGPHAPVTTGTNQREYVGTRLKRTDTICAYTSSDRSNTADRGRKAADTYRHSPSAKKKATYHHGANYYAVLDNQRNSGKHGTESPSWKSK